MAKRTPGYIAAERKLPVELHAQFAELVSDYRDATDRLTRYTGAPSFNILADLILKGWRK